ncbi:hypothetical protein ACO2Q3_22095 [Caulobacter sp. KR2-114]|uniref:hypothetical protein n=1 Tax=Caulobacter sp. KR2-114 TaxID=3400912 RepID=UPI003C0F0305
MIRMVGLALLAALLGLAAPAGAEESRLFTDTAPLQVTLSAPFPALVRGAATKVTAFPATLEVSDGQGAPEHFAIQLSGRGKTRRTGGYCKFPPLLLTFDKAAVKGTLFKHQHKLKLVTYCRDADDYEQRIVLEYLAYRLYNLVTPQSFRVRAAEVTYRNADGSGAPVKRFGFLIEDLNDVADRNDRDKLDAATHQVSASRLDARAAGRAALLEYMLGNLDWDFLAGPAGANCCHNSHYIAAHGAVAANATGVVPVPYDFDYSGFVDSPYADAPEGIPVARLTDRYYRGYCVSTPEMAAVADEFRAQRAAMTALIQTEPRLNAAFRGKALSFMDRFFAVLDDPVRYKREVVTHCR